MPEGEPRFHSRLLSPNCLVAVLPRTHPLRRRVVLDITELVGEPLLLSSHGFASREWFYTACQATHIKPRVIFESTTPHTLIALAAGDHGIAVLPTAVLIPRERVCIVSLVQNGASIGRWRIIAWNPERFLSPYAEWFIDELVTYWQRNYPNRDIIRRAPPLPRPKTSSNLSCE
jgi:DNA-binding transcriptional LysR family regulator